MQIKIVNNSSNLPEYIIVGSSGMDLRADLKNINTSLMFDCSISYKLIRTTLFIEPGGRCLIPSGLNMTIPEGYEIQVRPRSGLAIKHGISVLNTPGTVDSDYIGDVGVILINHGKEVFSVKQGDRIAQIVLCKVEKIEWDVVETLKETIRGENGFGHSGR